MHSSDLGRDIVNKRAHFGRQSGSPSLWAQTSEVLVADDGPR